jgi:transposase InsO family protein
MPPGAGFLFEMLDRAEMTRAEKTVASSFLPDRDYHTGQQARTEIFDYIELFYNRQRIHQSLDYQPPLVYQQRVA